MDAALTDGLYYSVRLAGAGVRYPLPVDGAACWHRGASARIELPDVPADHVIAASFASPSTAAPFAFRLQAGAARFETARFGRRTRRRERVRGAGAAVPVDYFVTDRDLSRPILSLLCRAPRPADYLLCVSVRPRLIEPPPGVPQDVATDAVPCLSQTTLAADVRAQACSPTATAMALGIGDRAGFEAFVAAAWHSPTGICGVWPQNLWAAARRGRLGGLELVSDWSLAMRAMAGGLPVVASIRFAAGELTGSPLSETGGHLVLVRGVENGAVVVNDPAAPPGSIERRYDAVQFAAAWMRHRGASYVFAAA